MTKKTIDSLSDLFDAIREDSIDFIAVLDYIGKRDSEQWDKGYKAAKAIYEPLLFSDNTVV